MTRETKRTVPPAGAESERDGELIEGLAERVVRLGMATPAISLLGRNEPHAPVRVDAMAVLGPIAADHFPGEGVDRFRMIFARRENVDRLLRAIVRREAEIEIPRKERRRLLPERRFLVPERRSRERMSRIVYGPSRARRSRRG